VPSFATTRQGRRYRAFTHVACITIPFRVEKDPASRPPAWFIVKIRSLSPSRRAFEVTAGGLACDAHRIRGAAVWGVAAGVASCSSS
jgi:hypothetical protein